MKTVTLTVLFLFFGNIALAKSGTDIPLGTYSGLSEGHSTVAFKLLKDGNAVITTEFYDGEDGEGKAVDKTEDGSWIYKAPLLTITFGKFKDQLKKTDGCYEKRPCFRFVKSEGKKKSPLDVEYPFLNWDAKP